MLHDPKYLNSTFEKDDFHKLVDYIMKRQARLPKELRKITAEGLVYSRTREEIQDKLQGLLFHGHVLLLLPS